LRFIDLLGGKCERCGATEGLQFDHRKPNKKEFRISNRIDAPEDILLKEVMKCVLLCAKCHRDKTRELGEHGQPKARHGTLHMYKHYGCRCKKCKKRMSEYNKERRMKMLALAKMVDEFVKEANLEKEGAEYQGKKVKLNDPVRNPPGSNKKFHVFVKDPSTGNVKKIQFGDPKMEIKRDDPDRRKNFRARHNCDNPGPKTKARYWSCYQWRGSKKVDSIDHLVDEFLKQAAFTSARSKSDIVSEFMKDTKQKAVRIGDILYEIDKDSGALTYYKPKETKSKDQTDALDKWIEKKEKEIEDSKKAKEEEERALEEEGIELGVLKPSEKLPGSMDRAVGLMNQIVTEAMGDQDILQMTVDLSKLIDEQEFATAFDMLKEIAKKTKTKAIHDSLIELAHVIANIRNEAKKR
jgi:hypothetical protein